MLLLPFACEIEPSLYIPVHLLPTTFHGILNPWRQRYCGDPMFRPWTLSPVISHASEVLCFPTTWFKWWQWTYMMAWCLMILVHKSELLTAVPMKVYIYIYRERERCQKKYIYTYIYIEMLISETRVAMHGFGSSTRNSCEKLVVQKQ